MSRSLSPDQVRRLEEIRAESAYHQGALDELYAQAADVVDVRGPGRERFTDELLWAGLAWTPDDAARWADAADSSSIPSPRTHA